MKKRDHIAIISSYSEGESYGLLGPQIAVYEFERDILPPNSTPLVIHHASVLGDWIRKVEMQEQIHYRRYGSIIGWWNQGRDEYPSGAQCSRT